jgi:hypothetical protein
MANWRRRLARWILEKLLRGDQGGAAKTRPPGFEGRPIYEHPTGELLVTSQSGTDGLPFALVRVTGERTETARLTPEQAARLTKNLHAWAATGGIA